MPKLHPFAETPFSLLPEPLSQMIRNAELPAIAAGPMNRDLADALWGGEFDDEFAQLAADQGSSNTATTVKLVNSGLWLLAGDLDRSHSLSQDLHSAEGSFWHGIMHRREGDFGNAKYWFRRVGEHPVIDQIASANHDLYSDPFVFVDNCAKSTQADRSNELACQNVQWHEWQSLMVHCLASDS
ncbi:hypothetical protein [Planctomycetes bacterium CA13]|uniref:hypothetical protein n=1 Tax=Novipirellula herctigrandis TaxID=2527986 RepID=UPI0011B46E74